MCKGIIRNLLIVVCCLLGSIHSVQAIPVANPDTYQGPEDVSLIRDGATGLLLNDSSDGGALTVILDTDVAVGDLVLQPDGSFTYDPPPDFHGTNTFQYKLSESFATQIFTIDSSQSRLNVNASLTTSFGSDSDSDASDVSGTLTVAVDPASAPFSQLQVTDIDASLTEAISLRFSFAFGLAGVNVTGQPGALSIDMVQAGAPSTVDGSGGFLQTNNTTRVSGTINVDATGLADGQVTEGDQFLDVEAVLDFDGQITQSGNTLTLTTPIVFNGSFDVSGNTITLGLTGTIVATSPVKQAVESSLATVTLITEPVPDVPELVTDRYFIGSNDALMMTNILSGGGAEVLVSTGSVWRYLDTGSDLGKAWRATGYDDSAWAAGPAQLGYGDGDEQTVIGSGAGPNNSITSYFRHSFNLVDAERQGSLRLRLLRDDGAAVYLNGVEIARSNLPADAGAADGAPVVTGNESEDAFFEFAVPMALMAGGTNILAVEVHQVSATSSDVSFDLELIRDNRFGGLTANDTDADGDTLLASLYQSPAHGSVTVSADGSFTYTPNPGFVGVDTFVYEAVDRDNRTARALLPWDSTWAYLDDGSDQGTNWLQATFDDSGWSRGAAELGYGDPDHDTVVGFVDTTPAVPTNLTKNATTYFRAQCYVGNAASLEDAYVRLLRDDAAAVYVNGVEVYRDANLPVNAGFDTYATSGVAHENEERLVSINASVLVDGLNTIAVEVHQVSATSSDMAFNLELGASFNPESEIFGSGQVWKFLADGSDQSNVWRQASYDDALWLSGPSKLGYGDDNVVTLVPDGGATHPLTVYFRSTFEVADISQVQTLGLDLLRDDGAAVYINNQEVVRDALPVDAAFDTNATATANDVDESIFHPFSNLDPSVLVAGTNSIAVEVHQASATSSDLGLDLRLRASMVRHLARVVIQVHDAGGFLDRDQDTMDDHWEAANSLDATMNDAAIDSDLDGSPNGDEFQAGTDPQDGASVFAVQEDGRTANEVRFAFPTVPGKSYRLQHTSNLDQVFVDIPGAVVTASGERETITVLLDAAGVRRYVRAVLYTP